MRPKAVVKIIVDIFMTLALLFLMGYPFWGDVAHEWAGTAMFLLFLLHHMLNANWYKSFFKNKYPPMRIFQMLVDVLVLLAMLGLMVSGMMLSNHVFDFLNIRGHMSFARLLHMVASHWGFVLMSLHLGLHWNMFLGITRKILKLHGASQLRKIMLPIFGAMITVYGMTVFIQRDFLTYMLLKTHFVFLDFNASIPLFYFDYLAIMGSFIFIAHYVSVLLRKFLGKKVHKKEA